MAKSERKGKKRNFTEIEVLVGEVEARKNILFGGLSAGISNKCKIVEWQHVTAAVNAVSSVPPIMAEIKKKWSDLKVVAKKRIAEHRRTITATGGGKGTAELTPLEEKIHGILGATVISGVLPACEGDCFPDFKEHSN